MHRPDGWSGSLVCSLGLGTIPGWLFGVCLVGSEWACLLRCDDGQRLIFPSGIVKVLRDQLS